MQRYREVLGEGMTPRQSAMLQLGSVSPWRTLAHEGGLSREAAATAMAAAIGGNGE